MAEELRTAQAAAAAAAAASASTAGTTQERTLEENFDEAAGSNTAEECMRLQMRLEECEAELASVKEEREDLHALLKKARGALDAQAEGIDYAIDLNNSLREEQEVENGEGGRELGEVGGGESELKMKTTMASTARREDEDVLLRAKRANDRISVISK